MSEIEAPPEVAPEIISKAATMGWSPKDQWRGDPEKWIPADKFVERGEQIMPILQANNRKLVGEVAALKNQLTETQQLLRASAESIEELKSFNTEMAKETGKQNKKQLVAAIAKAREDNDAEAEAELTEQLGEQIAALKKAEAKPATKPTGGNGNGNGQGTPPAVNPIVQQWTQDNPWFGTDMHRTAIAEAEASALRADANFSHLIGKREFLDEVARRTEVFFSGRTKGPTPKVDGGRTTGGTGGGASPSGGKTYSDLPQEAKDACDKYGQRMVGKGRAFPDMAAWQKHYVSKYFE